MIGNNSSVSYYMEDLSFATTGCAGSFSGGLGGQTIVASLRPVLLTEFENPKLGELNRTIAFESLFETGQVEAVDWNSSTMSGGTERASSMR
jgi:hypothetical protein